MHLGLTIILLFTAFPEACMEISEGKLVFPCLPDVVYSIGQLSLSDLVQLISSGWRQCPVERVLCGALCVTGDKLSFLGLLLHLVSIKSLHLIENLSF